MAHFLSNCCGEYPGLWVNSAAPLEWRPLGTIELQPQADVPTGSAQEETTRSVIIEVGVCDRLKNENLRFINFFTFHFFYSIYT